MHSNLSQNKPALFSIILKSITRISVQRDWLGLTIEPATQTKTFDREIDVVLNDIYASLNWKGWRRALRTSGNTTQPASTPYITMFSTANRRLQ